MTQTKRKLTDDLAAMAAEIEAWRQFGKNLCDRDMYGWAVTDEVRAKAAALLVKYASKEEA